MIITFNNNKIHAIKPGSPNFTINDGVSFSNRASIEITEDCPDYMRNTFAHAYEQGWIKPIAYVTDREMIFIGLTKP